MTLTKEQIINRQKQAPEGWHYDWRNAVIRGEHTLTRNVSVDADHILVANMLYRDEPGETRFDRPTGRQIPTLHMSLYHIDANGTGTSYGLGKWIDIGEIQKNKNYKALCKIADSITEESIMDIYNSDRDLLDHGEPLCG